MIMELVCDYLSYLEIERGLSANTVAAYKNDLYLFFEFLDTVQGGITDIENIKRTHLSEYIKYLGKKGANAATITRKIASIKGFFRYLCAAKEIKANPALSIASPKVSKKLPRVITMDEIEKLFKEKMDTRELAVFELLYATGLRVSELVELDIKNIDFKNNTVRTVGKGSKERVIPIGEKARNALKNYLKEREIDLKLSNSKKKG